jgi:hypothetical protein
LRAIDIRAWISNGIARSASGLGASRRFLRGLISGLRFHT